MITFFYAFLSVFIFNEIYYLFNRERLDTNFKNKDIESTTKADVLYYFTKVLYWVWIITGLFSGLSYLFVILFSLRFMKFPLFHINRKIYIIYDTILPLMSVLVLMIILFVKFIG